MATGGKKEGSSNLLKVGTLTLEPDDLDPHGVVVVRDKLVITDWMSDKVLVYRRHDGKLLSSTDKLESSPLGLCNVSDTEFCVAMNDGIIEIMSVQDSGLISRGKTFDLRSTFDECHGVALWNDNIVVCGRKDNTICWCVVSLQDGRPDKLHKVCKGKHVSYLTVKQDMAYILCAADKLHKVCKGFLSSLTVKQDMAYISCNSVDDHAVYGFNLLNPSQPTYTYKHKELGDPRGITVSDIGDLFVCDLNSSIHHLTGNCELVAIYKNDLPSRPYAIFWDSGVLYLTSWRNNAITMYKTPQPGPAIPAKAMTKMDIEDQKEKKQEAKISPKRPVISDDPVEQLRQTLSETGIHDSILIRLSKDLICDEWRFFFRELSVKDSEIRQIESDYHHCGVREKIYQLLCRSNEKGILHKTSILEALQKIERVDLVTKYKRENFPDS